MKIQGTKKQFFEELKGMLVPLWWAPKKARSTKVRKTVLSAILSRYGLR